MYREFEYSKHIMLWKHMAKEEVIEHIVSKTKAYMEINKSSTAQLSSYLLYTELNVIEEKKAYIYTIFREYVLNSCYACEAHVPCSACPIKIGRCSTGLYKKYLYAIANYTKTDNKEYLNEAIQCASNIAHAELNKETIEYYNIEVV